jgi:LPS-assembly lipoprotein
LVLSILLSSCGYNALYDQRASANPSVKQQMALIQVQPIKDRMGQYLHNKLLFRLNPKGKPTNPLYTLSIKLEKKSIDLGVKKSAVVTRGNLKILATLTLYQMHNLDSKIETKSLFTTTVLSNSSYDIPQAQYAALAALKDAQERALKEITENIVTRLGIYFRQKNQ